MSLNYSFIDENNINISEKKGTSIIKKPVENIATKVKRRLKLKQDSKAPTAQYEVFEDSDNEMMGHFDSDEADYQISKLDSGSGPIHAKNNQGVKGSRKQQQTAPVKLPPQESQSEYVKHYNTPDFNAISKANDSIASINENAGPMMLSSPQSTNKMLTNTNAPMVTGNQELITKLNYLIHLLEDQKDEKVGSITEELVLYCFLGVFIIFVLDSFVKVCKYVR